MPIAKKALITLAAALITSGLSAASFAAALDTSGVAGESNDSRFGGGIDTGGPSTPPPVSVCFYVFGGSICIPIS
jgi:hypothetical protein